MRHKLFAEFKRSAKILIVDDEPGNTQRVAEVLRQDGYRGTRCLNDSRRVLPAFMEWQPDLVILDLVMPFITGFQILNLITPLLNDEVCLPILIISEESSFGAKFEALSNGAMDYLTKPFITGEVLLRVHNMLRTRFQQLQLQAANDVLEEAVRRRTCELETYQSELQEAQIEVVVRLARAAEYHESDTAFHTQRVGTTSTLIAQGLDLTDAQVDLLRRASPLHDVGKIGIPDAVLLKPEPFNDEEREIMKQHCAIGAHLLSGGHSEFIQMAERIAYSHHEKWDGTGYPRGQKGEDIDIAGRIVAVADVFDALTHERPYKPAWPLEEAVAEILRQRGRHFDPTVVRVFMSLPHDELL